MELALCLEQTLGHRAHTRNLEDAVAANSWPARIHRVEMAEPRRSRVPWAFEASWQAFRTLRSGPAYDYPHDNPGHLTRQQLLPDSVVGQRFYLPDEREEALRERLEAWRAWREKRD